MGKRMMSVGVGEEGRTSVGRWIGTVALREEGSW